MSFLQGVRSGMGARNIPPQSHPTETRWPSGESTGPVVNPPGQRIFIRELSLGVVKNVLIGIVIAKNEARSFPDRKNVGQMRHQLSFTLRDTAVDFVNVTCWGQEGFISKIAKLFRSGDIIEMRNALVQSKQSNEYEERFRPWTPSSFQLVLSENHAQISLYSGQDFSEFTAIAHVPIKDPNDYYTLGDIISNGHSLNGSHVNVLAAVRDCGQIKEIVTKTGKQTKRRELKLFDQTCLSFPLVIWDAELAETAAKWTARDAVLFISDVKVAYDEFRQKMAATCDSKTIIIVNPDTLEAHHVYNYAQSATFLDDGLGDLDADTDLASIVDVFDLAGLEERLEKAPLDLPGVSPFCGIVYGCFTDFDIDGDATKCTSVRCASCRLRVNSASGMCVNSNCYANGMGANGRAFTRSFDIRVTISDHTAGMRGFVLAREVAEKILKCSVDDFISMSDSRKTELKWKFLLERYKIYFKALPNNNDARRPLLTILGVDVFDHSEMIRYLA